MVRLIPQVKRMEIVGGTLRAMAICCDGVACDERVLAALMKLPQDAAGAPVTVTISGDSGEGYELWIGEREIRIEAASAAGAFYAVQTLRQLFAGDEVPCLHITDEPDFAYRGFYQDITRGRVHTLATLKELIDRLAYYKYNSLQLYVEHTFDCEEYADVIGQLGYITDEELHELDAYCKQNFIDFIPSLSTFGHLYDLLHQEKYRHLCVLRDEQDEINFWRARHSHHTIDPLVGGSIDTVRHLIDQYAPHFTSEYFNICCDETFDLKQCAQKAGLDTAQMYIDFVKQIIAHVTSKGKKVMMWADVLLENPETIAELPQDTCLLNWDYGAEPKEEKIAKLANATQILCPGTSTWWRLCEAPNIAASNIANMAAYGKKYGALGLLNTNWGDYGNMATIDLAMFGLAVGAEKAWSVDTPIDDAFYDCVNHLVYDNENGMAMLTELSALQDMVNWREFCNNSFEFIYNPTPWYHDCTTVVADVQEKYKALAEKLAAQSWKRDEYRLDMLVAAEGICLTAELNALMRGESVERVTDTAAWLDKFRRQWLKTTKPSELFRIENMLTGIENKL